MATVELKRDTTFVLPRPPNYLIDANDESHKISVGELTKEEMRKVASAIAEAFVYHCEIKAKEHRATKQSAPNVSGTNFGTPS